MLSVKAIYEDGKILLTEPIELADNTEVILTFLDGDYPANKSEGGASAPASAPVGVSAESEVKDDAYYERMRAHKRFQAKGNISIVQGRGEVEFPLNDYSAGGLSFFADRLFNAMEIITAKIKYHAAGEILELDFEIRVMRVIDKGDKFLVGCQFLGNADEDLWHTIMA